MYIFIKHTGCFYRIGIKLHWISAFIIEYQGISGNLALQIIKVLFNMILYYCFFHLLK